MPWHAPFVEGGDGAIERALADLLKGSLRKEFTWHFFWRGDAGAAWGHKPNPAFFKWWGGWSDTPMAMRYATAFADAEVLALLQLPWPSPRTRVGSCAAAFPCGARPFSVWRPSWETMGFWLRSIFLLVRLSFARLLAWVSRMRTAMALGVLGILADRLCFRFQERGGQWILRLAGRNHRASYQRGGRIRCPDRLYRRVRRATGDP